MSDKPSYLGLLNSIAVGEAGGEELFCAWASVTPSPDVKAVLEAVMLREGEHAKSFAKRINELGYSVLPQRGPEPAAARGHRGSSTTLSDCEKFSQLAVGVAPKNGTDVFAKFMDDLTIDVQTGQLMGRYIAEERDSNRMLQSCRAIVEAEMNGSSNGTAELEARLGRIEQALEQLLAKA